MDTLSIILIAVLFFIMGAAVVGIIWYMRGVASVSADKQKAGELTDTDLIELARLYRNRKTQDLVVQTEGKSFESAQEFTENQMRRMNFISGVLVKWLAKPASMPIPEPLAPAAEAAQQEVPALWPEPEPEVSHHEHVPPFQEEPAPAETPMAEIPPFESLTPAAPFVGEAGLDLEALLAETVTEEQPEVPIGLIAEAAVISEMQPKEPAEPPVAATSEASPTEIPTSVPVEASEAELAEMPPIVPDETPEVSLGEPPASVSAEAPEAEPAELPPGEPAETPEVTMTEPPASVPAEAPEAESAEMPPVGAAETHEISLAEPQVSVPVEAPEVEPVEIQQEEPAETPLVSLAEPPVSVPVEAPEGEPVEMPAEELVEMPTGEPSETTLPGPAEIPVSAPAELEAAPLVEVASISDTQPTKIPKAPVSTPVDLGGGGPELPANQPADAGTTEIPVEEPAEAPKVEPSEPGGQGESSLQGEKPAEFIPPAKTDPSEWIKPVSTDVTEMVSGLFNPKPKPPVEFKSIAMQINDILQARLSGTAFEARGISVSDAPDHGVMVALDGATYSSIKDVPDLDVRELLRSCVLEWEKTGKTGTK